MKKLPLSLAVATALATTPVLAEESPYLQADDTWISLSGTAVDVGPDSFVLDYGYNTVKVEMDDWDWFEEAGEVLEGDQVSVYGEVDDDTFEKSSIEASSVYVESLGTYFYASAADEEGIEAIDMMPQTPVVVGDTVLTGSVTSIEGREFTIDSGLQEITVDTGEMLYNPLDDKGFQQIDKGEQVTVVGEMDDDLFESRELTAESIITLSDDSA